MPQPPLIPSRAAGHSLPLFFNQGKKLQRRHPERLANIEIHYCYTEYIHELQRFLMQHHINQKRRNFLLASVDCKFHALQECFLCPVLQTSNFHELQDSSTFLSFSALAGIDRIFPLAHPNQFLFLPNIRRFMDYRPRWRCRNSAGMNGLPGLTARHRSNIL